MKFNTHAIYQSGLFQNWINYHNGQWQTTDGTFATADWDELQNYLKDKHAVVFTEMVRQHWLPIQLADCWDAHKASGAIASLPSLEAMREEYINPEVLLHIPYASLVAALKEDMPESTVNECFESLLQAAAQSLLTFQATVVNKNNDALI